MGAVTGKAWTDYSEPRIMAADLEAIEAGSAIVGAGRPDIPATTPYSSAQLAAMPSGTVFRSTDGPQGAWEWMKQGATWNVTNGDTGWREITTLENGWTGTISVRRVLDAVHISGNNVSGAAATAATLFTLPTGYAPRLRAPISVQPVGGAPLYGRVHTSGFIQADYATSPTQLRDIYGVISTATSWPTTLPGTAA